MNIETNASTVNDGLKVANEATINTFKQTYNQFISNLKDASTLNMFINPSMKHIMGTSGQMPFEWNTDQTIAGNVTFNTASTGPTQIIFNNLTGLPSQSVFQVITQRLKPNTEYTLAFSVSPSENCEVSLNHPDGGLTDLRNTENFTGVFKSTITNPTLGEEYEDYFNFVTSDTITTVEFHITNTNPTAVNNCNVISVNRLYLFEGAVEFTNGYTREDFNENVQYDTTHGVWQLTNDGITYRDILTAGDIEGTINLDGKLNSLLFYVEHDDMGRHRAISLVDSQYNIAYQVQCSNQTIKTGSPTIYVVTPVVAHNDGVWDATYSYQLNDVVTYQNLKWQCIGVSSGVNLNHVPNGSESWWENVPNGVSVVVDSTFPTIVGAFYSSHAQTALNDSYNGIHAFVDNSNTTRYYTITGTTPTLSLIPNISTNTNAVSLMDAFQVQHDGSGEHVFKVGGVDKKLQLSLNHTTGVPTLSFVSYTRSTDTLTTANFISKFENSSATMFHDANGNHMITDTDGYLWRIGCNNGSFTFTPQVTAAPILAQFNWFRQEHDKYGRHVLRDAATGIYYRVYTAVSQILIEQTVFEPLNDINQFLNIYNAEHDINGDHYIRSQDLTVARKVTITDGGFGPRFSVFTPTTPVPEYHASRAMLGDTMHKNVDGNIHSFHIYNGVLIPNPL